MPVSKYIVSKLNDKNIWELIEEAQKKDWTMLCACHLQKYGLQNGHDYIILGTLELKDKDKTIQKMIKIRSPYDKETYNGPWRDDDV